jgi:hypothetical protein
MKRIGPLHSTATARPSGHQRHPPPARYTQAATTVTAGMNHTQ